MYNNHWKVYFSKDAANQYKKLSKRVISVLYLLVSDLEQWGPAPGRRWVNYGKLRGSSRDRRHCHLIGGKPTYVCCWEVIDKQLKIIKVYYAGTHEKAPY